MKYATKYLVVPYTKSLDNPLDAKINSLDQDMSDILARKINLDEKVKLYGQALNRFATLYNPESFSMPSVLATMNKKLDGMENQLDVIPNMPSVLATMNKKLDSLEDQLDGLPNPIIRPEGVKKSKKRKTSDLDPDLIVATKRSTNKVDRYGYTENKNKKSKKTVVFPDLKLTNEESNENADLQVNGEKDSKRPTKARTDANANAAAKASAVAMALASSVNSETTQKGSGLPKKWCSHNYF
jgi:hypothetical protein